MATVSGGVGRGGVSLGRLARVGALAVVLAVVVNVLIRMVAVRVFGVGEGFLPLGVGPTVFFTVVGVFGAVVVFGLMMRFAQRPVRLFRRVAVVVLVISLVPDLLLLFSGSMPGATVAGALTLMAEHVASWAVAVGVLAASWRRPLGSEEGAVAGVAGWGRKVAPVTDFWGGGVEAPGWRWRTGYRLRSLRGSETKRSRLG